MKKQFRLVLESEYGKNVPTSNPLQASEVFNVSVPDGYIQGGAILAVESFRIQSATTDVSNNGYIKINSPSFPMAYSYDSQTGNQTNTLVSLQGRTYQRNANDYIILRDSVFLTSKNIQIDIIASDGATYASLGAYWILVLTITEV